MKIAVVMMVYDYGNKSRGYSYEYINIYLPLLKAAGSQNVILFDFYTEYQMQGKEKMNSKLKELIASEAPDITLVCLFTDEFDENTLRTLSEKTRTVAYFFDDPWRKVFAEYWRKFFNFSTTPDYYSWLKYKEAGRSNILYVPFGYNSDIYVKTDSPKRYDVTFTGGYSPLRKWILNRIRNEGIKVEAFGRGWDRKWLPHEEMVRIFNESKINLNLSNSISYDYRFLLSAVKSVKDLKELILLKKNKEQIKGRHFEINGCGGFQLSCFVPGLNLVYEIDKEIAVYENIDTLGDDIRFYLQNEQLREEIAGGGYQRSVREHKAETYLDSLIKQVLLER